MKCLLLLITICLVAVGQTVAGDLTVALDISAPTGLFGMRLISTGISEKHGWMLAIKYKGVRGEEVGISRYCAEDIFEDRFEGETTTFTIADVGIFPQKSIFFIGGGFGMKTKCRRYYDRFGILGNDGHYYIEEGSSVFPHFMSGVMITPKESPVGFIFGIEMPPWNIVIGLSLTKPTH